MKLAIRVLVGMGLGIVLGLAPGTASAQDARAVVQAAATAMGANNLKTIQIPAPDGRRPWARAST